MLVNTVWLQQHVLQGSLIKKRVKTHNFLDKCPKKVSSFLHCHIVHVLSGHGALSEHFNSSLLDFTINVLTTNTQSASIFVAVINSVIGLCG